MKITNIDQLLPFVRQKPEFVVLQKDGFQVIDYVYQDQHTFDIPELLECRGIKFCPEGLILARPFRKFFNYGERGSDLPAHRPHVITEKLDGSMVHSILLERRLFFHTRKGHTDVAKKAERFVLSTPGIDYQSFSYESINDQWTPIFEYTGPNNRIVIRYEKEALTLVAMRHMITGEILPRKAMRVRAWRHNVPLVAIKNMTLTGRVDEFVQHTRGLKDAEGYVIYFDDGYMVKIKAEDYVLKHRALDDLGSKKKVVALCAQGFVDDVTAIVSEADANDLNTFNDALQKEIALEMDKVHNLVSQYELLKVQDAETARKQFALAVVPKGPGYEESRLRSAAFAAIDGKDARLVMIKHFISNSDWVRTKWRGE